MKAVRPRRNQNFDGRMNEFRGVFRQHRSLTSSLCCWSCGGCLGSFSFGHFVACIRTRLVNKKFAVFTTNNILPVNLHHYISLYLQTATCFYSERNQMIKMLDLDGRTLTQGVVSKRVYSL